MDIYDFKVIKMLLRIFLLTAMSIGFKHLININQNFHFINILFYQRNITLDHCSILQNDFISSHKGTLSHSLRIKYRHSTSVETFGAPIFFFRKICELTFLLFAINMRPKLEG